MVSRTKTRKAPARKATRKAPARKATVSSIPLSKRRLTDSQVELIGKVVDIFTRKGKIKFAAATGKCFRDLNCQRRFGQGNIDEATCKLLGGKSWRPSGGNCVSPI